MDDIVGEPARCSIKRCGTSSSVGCPPKKKHKGAALATATRALPGGDSVLVTKRSSPPPPAPATTLRGRPSGSAGLSKPKGPAPAAACRKLTVGTDCSGWESIILALKGMGVAVDHRFSCDTNKASKATILHNFAPKTFYDDIRYRDLAKMESVDVYHCGFPCQSFSHAGLKLGRQDQVRGKIMDYCLSYIGHHFPRVVLLENVVGLLTLHKSALDHIVRRLKGLGYQARYKVLNSKDHGLPQNRPRLFIIGLLEPAHAFKWPKSIPKPSLNKFIDCSVDANHKRLPPESQSIARKNVSNALMLCKNSR